MEDAKKSKLIRKENLWTMNLILKKLTSRAFETMFIFKFLNLTLELDVVIQSIWRSLRFKFKQIFLKNVNASKNCLYLTCALDRVGIHTCKFSHSRDLLWETVVASKLSKRVYHNISHACVCWSFDRDYISWAEKSLYIL